MYHLAAIKGVCIDCFASAPLSHCSFTHMYNIHFAHSLPHCNCLVWQGHLLVIVYGSLQCCIYELSCEEGKKFHTHIENSVNGLENKLHTCTQNSLSG